MTIGGRFDFAGIARLHTQAARLLPIALVVALSIAAPLRARAQSYDRYAPRAVPGQPAPPPAEIAQNPLGSGPALPPGYAPPAGPLPQGSGAPPRVEEVNTSADVIEIRVEGNKTIGLQKIMPNIKSRTNRPLDKSIVEDDVRRLVKTHWFADVDPRYERTDRGIVLVFRVVERPVMQYVRIYGSGKSEKTLIKKSGLKKGDPVDPYAVEEARTKIEEYLRGKAYAQASVVILEGNHIGDRGVKMMVNEGLKQKIWKIDFVGNTVAPNDRLKTVVQSKPPILWLFKGEVDYDRIEEDKRRIEEYYRDLGFFRARVGREWEFDEKQGWMTLTFVIDEGPRYQINNISVIGNQQITSEALVADFKLKGGEYFDKAKLSKDMSGLQDKYGEIGYVFADVQPETRFLDQPGQLDLVYKVEEGDRYHIGRISVKILGENPHTRNTAILSRLTLRTGDIANTKKLRDSERRLKASSMLNAQPSQGEVPKIVFSKPGMNDFDEEEEASIARKPRKKGGGFSAGGPSGGGGGAGGAMPGMGFSGQSPDPEPAQPGEVTLHDGESVAVELVREPSPRGPRQRTTVARPAFEGTRPQILVRPQSPDARYAAPSSGYASGGGQQAIGQQPLGRTGPDAIGSGTRPAIPPLGGVAQTQYNQPTTVPVYSQPPPAGAYGSAPAAAGNYNALGSYGAAQPSNGYSAGPSATYAPPGGYSPPTGYGAPAPAPYAAPAAGSAPPAAYGATPPPAYGQVLPPPAVGTGTPAYGAPSYGAPPPAISGSPGGYSEPEELFGPPVNGNGSGSIYDPEVPTRPIDVQVIGQETQTGRLMLGVGVNSNAGLIGNITLDEQNFDWRRFPRSWEDIRNATAWRGGGQQFRIQASPGTVYQQYMVSFNNPYLFGQPVSFGTSGSYFTRIYQDWTEKRLGGRFSLGYQFLFDPNLSTLLTLRAENVNISNPTVPTPPQLQQVVGNNAYYSGRLDLVHDTRDSAFLPTQGHRIDLGFEQAFGTFTFPKATIDVAQHFLLHERPDTSGRHTLSLINSTGFTGNNTPIYENFFAGGYTTLRGFFFRGASPLENNVQVGGHFMFINTAEYMFPITGDDMLKGVAFTDFGTVEPSTEMKWDDFRIAPGLGLRVTIPAMGPAPIALDFSVPIHHAPGDHLQLFSFWMGLAR